MLTVVTGPPAAGKSSWVQAQAGPKDIVIDFDRLAAAFTGPGSDGHTHQPLVRKVAYRAWRGAITEALRHVDQVDVYLIHAAPNQRAMAEYQAHGARVVTVDPGRDVVMRRCEDMRTQSAAAMAEKWYATVSDDSGHTPTIQASRDW